MPTCMECMPTRAIKGGLGEKGYGERVSPREKTGRRGARVFDLVEKIDSVSLRLSLIQFGSGEMV